MKTLILALFTMWCIVFPSSVDLPCEEGTKENQLQSLSVGGSRGLTLKEHYQSITDSHWAWWWSCSKHKRTLLRRGIDHPVPWVLWSRAVKNGGWVAAQRWVTCPPNDKWESSVIINGDSLINPYTASPFLCGVPLPLYDVTHGSDISRSSGGTASPATGLACDSRQHVYKLP